MASALTRGNRAIVATNAGATKLIVIHGIGYYRCPWSRPWCMAGITQVTAVNMAGTLARGRAAIVATTAGSDYLIVVHSAGCHRAPGRELRLTMAGLAHIGTVDVSRALARSDGTIVTARTGSHDLIVIYGTGCNRCP